MSETFDIDAWIDGATPITHRVTLYQRGDLIAELEDIDRQIELAEAAGDAERGLDDATPDTLRLRRTQIAEEWLDSGLHLWVRPFTVARNKEIVKQGKKDRLSNEDANQLVLAKAIVRMQQGDADPVDLPDGLPLDRLKRLQEAVGEAQSATLTRAYFQGLLEVPDVDPTSSPADSET